MTKPNWETLLYMNKRERIIKNYNITLSSKLA
jgi:hypothetical protein